MKKLALAIVVALLPTNALSSELDLCKNFEKAGIDEKYGYVSGAVDMFEAFACADAEDVSACFNRFKELVNDRSYAEAIATTERMCGTTTQVTSYAIISMLREWTKLYLTESK